MTDKKLNNADIGMLFLDLNNICYTQKVDADTITSMVFRAIKTFSETIMENGQIKTYGVVNENLTPKAEGKEQ